MAGLIALQIGGFAHAEPCTLSLALRSVVDLSAAAAVDQKSFTISGLSGITYAGGSTFWAVMDNSDKLACLKVTFSANASILAAIGEAGRTLSHARDHEGIALAGDGSTVFVSNEGAAGLHEHRLRDGQLTRTLALPMVYGSARGNLGLESLSRSGHFIWVANEEALAGDGPLADGAAGSVVRLQQLCIDPFTGNVTWGPQYAYSVAAMHKPAKDVPPREETDLSRSGLVDIVAIPDGQLLSLERSFVRADAGILSDAASDFQSRIYLIETAVATDVGGVESLASATGTFEMVKKRLLWSQTSNALAKPRIGNMEGLALGPRLSNGNHAVLGVVDSGDGVISRNKVVSFELGGCLPQERRPACTLLHLPVGNMSKSHRTEMTE